MMGNADSQLTLEIEGRLWPLKDGDVIGRLGTVGGEALRQYDVLSRQHLRVEQKGGRWQITLLPKAGNETLCNGEAMTPGEAVPVPKQCEIHVVTLTLVLRLRGEPGPAHEVQHPAALVTLDRELRVVWRNTLATQVLNHELPLGMEFLQLVETGATLRLRYALMALREGAELEECEVVVTSDEAQPWVALRAARSGGQVLLALRNVSQERQQRAAVEDAAGRLDAKVGALTTLLTAPAFVEGDLAAALPLLVQDAEALLDETAVSAWLPAESKARAGAGSDANSRTFTRRAAAGRGAGPVGKQAVLAKAPKGGEVAPAVLATLRGAGLLEEVAGTAWIEPMGEHGVLVFQRQDATRAWLEPEVRLAGLAAALGKQLFGNAQRREVMQALQAREAALSTELGEAAQYVERRLPAAIAKGPVTVDWIYQPCGRLGGDMLGYEWLDEHRFTVYVADVMGHGVRASLHALSLAQTLKLLLARGAGDDPAAWLAALNKEFPMKEHEGLLWTMWCGLYDRRTRTLRHASGGHPPAFLCHGDKIEELCSAGPVLGAMEEAEYRSESTTLPVDVRLFLYTDGVYEFPTSEGATGTLADFKSAVGGVVGMKQGECAFLKTRAAGLCAEPEFPDDFTILRVRFGN